MPRLQRSTAHGVHALPQTPQGQLPNGRDTNGPQKREKRARGLSKTIQGKAKDRARPYSGAERGNTSQRKIFRNKNILSREARKLRTTRAPNAG
eukprot:7158537-Alexandrium_andersonii.AAC.1